MSCFFGCFHGFDAPVVSRWPLIALYGRFDATSLCLPLAQVVLMGSSTGIPEKKAAVVFLEDMTAAEAVKAGATLPAGLRNVGNTCYMASTLQCLRGENEGE